MLTEFEQQVKIRRAQKKTIYEIAEELDVEVRKVRIAINKLKSQDDPPPTGGIETLIRKVDKLTEMVRDLSARVPERKTGGRRKTS